MSHKSNGEKMAWISFREKLREKRASTVINHITPKTTIFRLHTVADTVGLASVNSTLLASKLPLSVKWRKKAKWRPLRGSRSFNVTMHSVLSELY